MGQRIRLESSKFVRYHSTRGLQLILRFLSTPALFFLNLKFPLILSISLTYQSPYFFLKGEELLGECQARANEVGGSTRLGVSRHGNRHTPGRRPGPGCSSQTGGSSEPVSRPSNPPGTSSSCPAPPRGALRIRSFLGRVGGGVTANRDRVHLNPPDSYQKIPLGRKQSLNPPKSSVVI